jgi:hypothetical protein
LELQELPVFHLLYWHVLKVDLDIIIGQPLIATYAPTCLKACVHAALDRGGCCLQGPCLQVSNYLSDAFISFCESLICRPCIMVEFVEELRVLLTGFASAILGVGVASSNTSRFVVLRGHHSFVGIRSGMMA